MQILAFIGDNASNNDTQTAQLEKLANSFEAANRVHCFNHTMQISAKALLKPFSTRAATSDSHDEDTLDVVTHDNDDDVGVSAEADDEDAGETEESTLLHTSTWNPLESTGFHGIIPPLKAL